MKFKVTTDSQAVAESNGSSYISKSGIYDATIKFASLDVTKGGAEQVNFNIEWEGNSQTIYGPYVTNKDGNTNEIGAKLINKLAIIAGMTDGDDFEIESEEHAVGKDNKVQEFAVIQNFSDLDIKIRLQEEYSISKGGANDGQIRKSMVIKSFFREDGASAEEIVNNADVGARLAIEQDKYASHITYKDDLTAEDVEAWKESKKSGNAAASQPKAKVANTAKTNKLFQN